ncbi:hypothetical protein MKX41_17190 [Paenibacillus sp. FSL R5-0475]|uniref:hypothetical protein n=1 Tax=Paenibacillus sp. FSL R5-0475 TaxID=2921643 RepID=UPI0030F62059
MQAKKPIELLREDDQRSIYIVQSKLKNGTADFSDLGEVMRVVQQNPTALNSFGITMIVRIAELHFKRPDFVDYGYTLDNLNSAFGIR